MRAKCWQLKELPLGGVLVLFPSSHFVSEYLVLGELFSCVATCSTGKGYTIRSSIYGVMRLLVSKTRTIEGRSHTSHDAGMRAAAQSGILANKESQAISPAR